MEESYARNIFFSTESTLPESDLHLAGFVPTTVGLRMACKDWCKAVDLSSIGSDI